MTEQNKIKVFIHAFVNALAFGDYNTLNALFTIKERVIYKTMLSQRLTLPEAEYKKKYNIDVHSLNK